MVASKTSFVIAAVALGAATSVYAAPTPFNAGSDLATRGFEDDDFQLEAREFDDELEARNFDDAEEILARHFDEEEELYARSFFDDEEELVGRDFDEEEDLFARDFDDEEDLFARDFDEEEDLFARDFDDEEDLFARDFDEDEYLFARASNGTVPIPSTKSTTKSTTTNTKVDKAPSTANKVSKPNTPVEGKNTKLSSTYETGASPKTVKKTTSSGALKELNGDKVRTSTSTTTGSSSDKSHHTGPHHKTTHHKTPHHKTTHHKTTHHKAPHHKTTHHKTTHHVAHKPSRIHTGSHPKSHSGHTQRPVDHKPLHAELATGEHKPVSHSTGHTTTSDKTHSNGSTGPKKTLDSVTPKKQISKALDTDDAPPAKKTKSIVQKEAPISTPTTPKGATKGTSLTVQANTQKRSLSDLWASLVGRDGQKKHHGKHHRHHHHKKPKVDAESAEESAPPAQPLAERDFDEELEIRDEHRRHRRPNGHRRHPHGHFHHKKPKVNAASADSDATPPPPAPEVAERDFDDMIVLARSLGLDDDYFLEERSFDDDIYEY